MTMRATCPMCGGKAKLIRPPDVFRCRCGELFLGDEAVTEVMEAATPELPAQPVNWWQLAAATALCLYGLWVAAAVLLQLLGRLLNLP